MDTETTGLDVRHGARPYLVTICDEKGDQTWWEWDVDPRTRKVSIPRGDLSEIADVIEGSDRVVFQNAKFDIASLVSIGLRVRPWAWSNLHDTLVAGHLIASNQPHGLTSMVLQYLGADIDPFDQALKEACNEARRLVRSKDFSSKHGEWRIAKEGLPEMPSAKGGSKVDAKGVKSESPWKSDGWLPRAVAEALGYPQDHPWRTVLRDYANTDSSSTMALWTAMEPILRERKLWRIYEERLRIVPVVVRVEANGVTGSVDRSDEIIRVFGEESERLGAKCVSIAKGRGYDLSLPASGRNKSLDEFVFDVLGLERVYDPKSRTGKPTLDSKLAIPFYLDTLPEGSDEREFIELLSRKRKRDTLVSYLRSYERFRVKILGKPGWWRIHPTLNPTGTGTLRFSSSNPNSQSVGKQDVEGGGEDHSIRHCFGPLPGREWWALDYENIELRIPAYESGEDELIRLFEASDEPPYYGSEHLLNFSTVYPDIWESELREVGFDKVGPHIKEKYADTWYRFCKFGGFAVGYGAIERTDSVGTADRAFRRKGSHARLKSRFARKESLNQKYIAFAEKHGYVETLPDKTVDPDRGYPIMCSRSEYGKILPTVPLNYHVQSTAMWCTSRAMVRCQEILDEWNRREPGKNYKMTMQVHDEIVFDFPVGDNWGRVQDLRKAMEMSGDDIGVPMRVSVSYHPENWGDKAKYKEKPPVDAGGRSRSRVSVGS